MTNTKYIISSRKVIAVALAIVMFAMMFVGCTKNEPVNNDGTTTTESTTLSQSGESTTLADNQTENEESTTLADENNENENNTSKYNSDETTTKKNISTGGKETTTKKNTSTGSSDKVTTTNKNSATCSHSWGNWKTMGNPDNSSTWYEARTCSKCGYEAVEEGDYKDACMGSKSEYLELLGYVNQARREAGLNELVYITEWQSGANTRAKDLTQVYSHKRPNGSHFLTAYNSNSSYNSQYGIVWCGGGENIVSGARTAKQAFDSWMSSSGHRKTILNANSTGIVIARCDTYWVMNTFASVE